MRIRQLAGKTLRVGVKEPVGMVDFLLSKVPVRIGDL